MKSGIFRLIILFLVVIFIGTPGFATSNEPNYGPYMRKIQSDIKANWFPPKGHQSNRVVTLFKVAKDGKLLACSIYKSSGSKDSDSAAIHAIKATAPFEPLPENFKGKSVDIQFTFDYNVLPYPNHKNKVPDGKITPNAIENRYNSNRKPTRTSSPTCLGTSIVPPKIVKVTQTIEAQKTGEKGKNYFYCSNGKKCSTEDVVKEYYQDNGYNVMRGEVAVWQGLFALAFFDEIFYNHQFSKISDIPRGFFVGDFLYQERKKCIIKNTSFWKVQTSMSILIFN